jgi:hypothetical protein
MGWNTTRAKIEIVVESAETRKMKDCKRRINLDSFLERKCAKLAHCKLSTSKQSVDGDQLSAYFLLLSYLLTAQPTRPYDTST